MTREEAITIIDSLHLIGCGRNQHENDLKINVALDMATEALSADTKGDLISRQWLLEVYGDYIGDNGEPKYHVPLEVVRQNIKDAPSADRLSGEWKYLYGSIGSYMTISCPFCGETFNDVAEWKYNYCPNCGAKMNKGGDTE